MRKGSSNKDEEEIEMDTILIVGDKTRMKMRMIKIAQSGMRINVSLTHLLSSPSPY